MKKIFIFKLFINFILFAAIIFMPNTYAKNLRIVSIAPNLTEIIYALNAQDYIVGVSTFCDYPKEVSKVKKVGDSFYVNKEEILKLKPDYIFALSSTRPMLSGLNNSDIKIVYFDFKNIDDIYNAIKQIGEITGKSNNANRLIAELKRLNTSFKANCSKNILYLIQTNPSITIGKKSYITEIITLSGHKSVTENINFSYPSISTELLAKIHPDVIVILSKTDIGLLKKLHPNAKYIYLDSSVNNIINRPSPRIYKAVEYFSKL